MKQYKYQILNTLGLFAVIYVNYLANALPINGYNTGELSSFYPNLFVPAGITFSIWGIIYLLLIGFVIVQWRSANKQKVSSISWLFLSTCVLNILWIFAWHYRFEEVSVLVMITLLLTLIKIYQKLNSLTIKSIIDKLFIRVPFQIYFGWICVATIANATALLVHWDFNPETPELWAVTMIGTTPILAYLVNRNDPNFFYSATLIWALFGIITKRNYIGGPEVIIFTSYIAIAAILLIYLIKKFKAQFTQG